jgi:hypothetical protein
MKEKVKTEFDRQRVIGIIQRLDLSKPYTVTISQRKGRRSLDQNALMWLWLTCIESETGNDRIYLHEHFKKKWILPKRIVIFGEEQLTYSTADLDTAQFSEYLDKLQAFAATELAITLPDPNDKHWDDFFDYYRDRL